MRIAVTGTPGTGKTKIAKILAKKLGLKYLSIKELVKGLIIDYDRRRDCFVVDVEKMKKIKLNKDVIVEGVIAHFLDPNEIDFCIVLRASPRALKMRLKKRGWRKSKIEENVEAEKLDVCLVEALENGHKVIEVDTTGKSAKEVVDEIIKLIKRGRERYGVVNWMR